jgi:menaquinol-cytochrome c reductase iron-sulfur subunit
LFPIGHKVVSSSADPVDVGAEALLEPGGAPIQVPVIAAAQRDAWGTRDRVAVGSVWLSKDRSGNVTALSAVCPHLGCAINYDDRSDRFRCPCHASSFGRDGARETGPAKRGMDPLPVRVAEGRVKVTFLRFRPDVAERTPV